MRFLRLLYQPNRVFGELKEHDSFIPPLAASAVLSLASGLFLLAVLGSNAVVRSTATGVGFPELPPGVVFCIFRIFAFLINLLAIVAVFYVSLRIFKSPIHFRTLLTVCAYAAFVREVLRLVITVVAISYGEFSHQPLRIITNATAFFDATQTGRPLYYLAGLVDLPAAVFLALVILGLLRVIVGLRVQKAVPLIISSWLLFAVLGYSGHQ